MSTPLERAAEALAKCNGDVHYPEAWADEARAALEAAIDEGELVTFLSKWRFNGFIENAEFAEMLKTHLLGGAE